MFHVFHLGPFDRRRTWLVGAIDEFGRFVQPIQDASLKRALKLMVESVGEGDVTFEPALAAFALELGVPVGPLPEYLDDAPAVLAFSAVNIQEHLPMGTGIRTFLDACGDYGSVAPWDRYRVDEPFLVRVLARNKTTTREAVVCGGTGEPHGLMLFDRPGSAVRAVAALRNGDTRAAQRCDAITLAFEPGPEWALRPIRTAFSLPEFPYVFRTRRGNLPPASEVELGILTAALVAVTLLVTKPPGDEEPAEAVLCIDGHEFRAVASPPGARLPTDDRTIPALARGAPTRGPSLLRLPDREDLN